MINRCFKNSIPMRRCASFSQICLLVLIVAVYCTSPASAAPRHGLSAFGDLKYPEGFLHFDYVNPKAPKGGTLSQMSTSSVTTFDSFNRYILKGDSADGLELLFDSLMQRAWDEPDAMYGLVARAAEVAADKKSVTFWMRPEARFADGTKVTSADVVFSFKVIKEKGHPLFRIQLRDVVGAEALAPLVVKYTFKGTEIRDLPLIVAGLPIFSKAYYSRVDFAKTSLKPPLGSGPYRIGKFKQGSYVTYRRRPDYWAKALNVNRGRYNFDAVRIEYFRDRNAGMESFKAGVYDLREEFTSRVWATGYDFPAVRDGRVKLAVLPDRSPSGAQGFFINIRREKFKDVRVRKALGLAFDFSWTNRNMFYGLYKRTESYFENSALKAKGIASTGEQAILSSAVQPGDTTSRYEIAPVPAKSNGSGRDRRLLRQAYSILGRAGLALPKAGAVPQACGFGCRALKLVGFSGPPAATVLRDGKGRPFNFEFLLQDPDFERIINPYLANLRALGINAWGAGRRCRPISTPAQKLRF